MDNLPELRDIHLPDGVSVWPPAYGWWVILCALLVVVVLYHVVRIIRQKSRKLYALRMIERIGVGNAVEAAQEMSEVLRRICVYKYKSAATLYGAEWLEFLNKKSVVKLEGEAAELLINAPYMDTNDKAQKTDNIGKTHELKKFCKNWIGENL